MPLTLWAEPSTRARSWRTPETTADGTSREMVRATAGEMVSQPLAEVTT